jgi:hypothetical protein
VLANPPGPNTFAGTTGRLPVTPTTPSRSRPAHPSAPPAPAAG